MDNREGSDTAPVADGVVDDPGRETARVMDGRDSFCDRDDGETPGSAGVDVLWNNMCAPLSGDD